METALQSSLQVKGSPNAPTLRHGATRAGIDVAAAAVAAIVVSPIMTIIDRAVIEAAAGHKSVVVSARSSLISLVQEPATFVGNRSFTSMVMLYLGTYITANVSDTILEQPDTVAGTISSDTSKLGAVVGVNVCLSLYKDSVFARAAGGQASFPARALIPFLVRDTITLYATFCLPAWFSGSSETTAMLLCPAASQFVATPLHLLGLDLYNRRLALPVERFRLIGKTWAATSIVRACRVLPAYGLGSLVNTAARQKMLDHV